MQFLLLGRVVPEVEAASQSGGITHRCFARSSQESLRQIPISREPVWPINVALVRA
jgi:hypothetical protein